jgi:plastocyanin
MKKLYTLLSLFAAALTVNAATINVQVGGSTNTFTPANFSAVVGDVVIWTWMGGTHNVTSTSGSVPAGATVFASPTQSTGTYSYTITVAGSYGYACTLHAGSGMIGTFTASATGILEPATDLLTNAYPNPFRDKITVKYNNLSSIDVFNMVGDKVKTIELSPVESKMEINFEGTPAGVYFMRTYNKEGVIVETKKIVKTK